MQDSLEERSFERKYHEAREFIQEWIDKQGYDRCWHYPELFRRLAYLFEVRPTHELKLPPKEEFKKGCEKYQDEAYNAQ